MTEERKRWFNATITPKAVTDKEGNPIEGRMVANAFWPKREANIDIKPLSDKHSKSSRKKVYDKGFK